MSDSIVKRLPGIIGLILVLFATQASAALPPALWIGIDDGRPHDASPIFNDYQNHCQVYQYLVKPAVLNGKKDSRWALEDLVKDFFKDNPEDKKRLNLFFRNDPGYSYQDLEETAISYMRLDFARHFNIALLGTKEESQNQVVVEVGLTWVTIGTGRGLTIAGSAPEIRFSVTASDYISRIGSFSELEMQSLYRQTFSGVMRKLINSLLFQGAKNDVKKWKNHQFPVMIQNLKVGENAEKLIREYLLGRVLSEYGLRPGDARFDDALTRQRAKFRVELNNYLQMVLIQELQKNNDQDLALVSFLPPKGSLDYLKMGSVWQDYISRIAYASGKKIHSNSLPNPVINEVDYACRVNAKKAGMGLDGLNWIKPVHGIWIRSKIQKLERILFKEDKTQKIFNYDNVFYSGLFLPLNPQATSPEIRRNLPDLDSMARHQLAIAACKKPYMQSKAFPSASELARQFFILQAIQGSIKNDDPDKDDLVEQLVKKLKQTVKLENRIRIYQELKGAQCQ